MSFDRESLRLLEEALHALEGGFKSLPSFDSRLNCEEVHDVLLEVSQRLHDNFPYHHPLYIGQMLKPPHPLARLAYALSMYLNPNNHALDGGRASSEMEKQAVAEIASMFGWGGTHLGHLTGGGTVANFEALWISRELAPDKAIAASTQAHYTHRRLCSVLSVPLREIPVDARGQMNITALEEALRSEPIGTIVATLGTTAAGALDPLHLILELRDRYEFRLHVDAAYGGYFTLAANLDADARRAFDLVSRADSIVIDPHKHGLQPYGCGCVLFRDAGVGRFYKHDSPYTYFSSDELHLGEISLECSRAGASAVALWATQRLLPLKRGGAFARGLDACLDAARTLHDTVRSDERFACPFRPQLDIVNFAVRAPSASVSSALARNLFDAAAKRDLHLALANLPRVMLEGCEPVQRWDQQTITCVRACAMKPDHREWMPQILKRLSDAASDVLRTGP